MFAFQNLQSLLALHQPILLRWQTSAFGSQIPAHLIMVEPVAGAFSSAFWSVIGEVSCIFFFSSSGKATLPFQVVWNVVVYLATELKGFAHLPTKQAPAFPGSALGCVNHSLDHPQPQEGEVVDNSIQLCLAPSGLWQMFLYSFRDKNVFTFRERIT